MNKALCLPRLLKSTCQINLLNKLGNTTSIQPKCLLYNSSIIYKSQDKPPTPTFKKEDLKSRLSPIQLHVTQEKGTERPFTGKYNDHNKKGTYTCVVCSSKLFQNKFDAGCGWPSFSDVIDTNCVTQIHDFSHGMARTEVTCSKCESHLGHVFNDGPRPTGQRFCINSASLSFNKEEN